MKKAIPIIITVSIVLVCAVFYAVYSSMTRYSLDAGTYRADPEIDDIYQKQMHDSKGNLNPLIYEFDYLTEKDVGALILASQECEYANPLVPLFTQECPAMHAFALYADKMGVVSKESFWEVTKNLAFHPSEKVRQTNLNFLLAFMAEHPDELFRYLRAQHSDAMDYAFYNYVHHPDAQAFEAALILNSHAQTQAYLAGLKDTKSPLLRATIHEENMTPREIANGTEDTKEGALKVFYSDGVMTPKEAEALFLLFERCNVKESDLMPEGECHALGPFEQFLSSRVFRQDELDLGALIKKMWSHEHPTVRAVAWTLSHHLYTKELLEQLKKEQDVKALGAYVWLSKRYYPDKPQMRAFYRQLVDHPDARVRNLVEIPPLTAEEFEARLLKLDACGKVDKKCREFDEFQAWLVGYAELNDEQRAVLVPVLEKHFLSDKEQISLVTASMVMPMAYAGKMGRPFAEYAKDLTARGTDEVKMSVLITLILQAKGDAKMAEDATLKQSLSSIIESLSDEGARKQVESLFGSVFAKK